MFALNSTSNIPEITPGAIEGMGPRLERYRNLLIEWVQGNLLELTVAIAAAVLLFLALSWLRRVAVRIARESEHRAAMKSIIARTLARTSKFFRVMVAVELVNGFANAPVPLAQTIQVLFTVAFVIQVAVWLREIILGLIERRAGEGEHEHETLASAMVLIRVLVSFGLFAIAAIVILDNLGVNVTGLIAGLGVGGIAIGLAAQGIFSDLFAAISIIFDKPFQRGDVVSYDTTTATVEKIGMKSTRLRSVTGEEKIISNAKLLEKEITNFTRLTYRRTTFTIGIAFQTAPEKLALIPDLMRRTVEAQGAKFVRGGFTAFGASALDFQLLFDIASANFEAVFEGRHRVGLAILKALQSEDIAIATPIQMPGTFAQAAVAEVDAPSPGAKPRRRAAARRTPAKAPTDRAE